MCTPKLASGTTSALQTGAQFTDLLAGNQKSRFQQQMNKRQQAIFRRKAENATAQAREAGQLALQKNAFQRGVQRVNFAKSGVSTASGSAAKSLQELAQTGRFSAQQQQHQGASQSSDLRQRVFDLQAENALEKSQRKLRNISGGLSLLGGGIGAANKAGWIK